MIITPDFGTVMAIIPRVSVLANDHDIQVAFLKSVDDYLFYVSDQVEDWDQMEPYIYDIIEDHEGFSDLLERLQSPYRSVHHLPWGDSFIVGDSFNENLLEEIEPYLLHFAKEYPYSTLRYLVDLCAESYKGLGSQYLMEVLRNCATIIEAGDKFWDWLEDTIDEIPTTWANKDEISKWSQKVMSDYSKKF